MLVRRLQAIQKENNELWDYDETDELPDLFAIMQREKELEAEAEQLLLAHGLDPNKLMAITKDAGKNGRQRILVHGWITVTLVLAATRIVVLIAEEFTDFRTRRSR